MAVLMVLTTCDMHSTTYCSLVSLAWPALCCWPRGCPTSLTAWLGSVSTGALAAWPSSTCGAWASACPPALSWRSWWRAGGSPAWPCRQLPHHKVMHPWPGGSEAEPPLGRRAGAPFQTGEWSRSLEAPAREAGVRRALLSSLQLSCLEMPRRSSISGPWFSYLGSGHLDWTFPWVSPHSDFSPKRQCSPELGVWSPGLVDWVHTQPCPFLPAWSWAGEPRGWGGRVQGHTELGHN